MRWREGRDRMRIGSLMVLIVYLYLTVVIMPTMTQSAISLFNNTSNATNSETDNISEPTSMPIPSFYTNTSEINKNLTIPVLVGVPDFAVTNITFNPSEPVIGDVVEINATVSNFGVKNGTAYVEFYDNKSIELKRTQDDYSGWKSTNDTITLPGALKMRVHFSHIGAYSSLIIIYDRNNSKVERFDYPPDDITDYWTTWCDGDTIRIESQWGDFTVDRYDALLANESVSLNAARLTNISTKWNLSDQYMGWATHGEHNITVIVDHSNQVVESEETNNSRDGMVVVNPSLDFTVTNISFNEPSLNETVELTATVANYGVRDGTATVRAYCDEIIVNETVVSLNFTDHPKMVAMWWNANITNGGAGRHNISVEIDPDKVFVETTDENNSFHERIFVNGTDLAVTDIEIPCGQFGGRRCYRDKNETIAVIIANLGARNASTFTVMFSDGLGEGNRSGSAFFNKTIPRLNSSETTNINVTWTPREFGKHTITVSIPFDKRDNDEMNNELLVNVSVKPEYDVSVEDVSVYPARVKEGDNVTINASIANLGLKNGSVNVSFYVNSTDIVGSKHERYIEIGRTNQPVYVEPDKINNISFTWNAKITGGDHLIYAVVDPGNEVPEWPGDFTIVGESIILKDPVSAGNNVKSCILQVNHTQLSITNLTLAPSKPVIENKINVTAMIENNGNETANSTVQFYIEKSLEHTPGTGEERYSIFQPENLPIRVHFKYLEILTGDGSVCVDIDGERVSLYVKSVDVAEGQPIKVSEINFDSPCGDCLNHDATGTCTKRQWEDVWTEWRTAKNLTVHEHLINTSIDKYQVQLGNDTITMDANRNSSYNVMWNASLPLKVKCERKDNRFIVYDEKNLVGENYTLIANVENEVVRNETYLSGTDLAVDFSVNKTYFDGEEVNITAVIENLGLKNATEFMVNFSESYYVPGSSEPIIEPIYSTTIENLAAGNTTNISVPWNASIYKYGWHKNGEWIYDYTLKVEIKPLNNAKYEEKRGNDLKNWQVQLKCSRDFIIPNLSFVVNNETRDAAHDAVRLTPGETVTVNATLNVTNLAKNRGGTVDVSFYVDKVDNEHEIGNDSVEFGAGNGTSHAEIEWYVWDFGDVKIADDHDIIVVADPENKINELNESNNAATWQIHTYAAELTVTSLYFEPDKEKINKSDRINISFEVANYGHEDAKNVSLVVYDCADRQIENKDIKVYGSVLYPGLQEREIEHEKAKATKLYLDLEIDDGVVCIHDSRGGQIGLIEGVTGVIFKDNLSYYENFHGWTPWLISGDVCIEAAGNASAKVSKVYYLEPGEDAINTTYNLSVDRTEEKIIHISDNWTASTFGERLIVATIDPGNEIQEYNELNNTFARYITVNTSDLAADINLRWLNGTEIEKNAIIRDNDTVRIAANIINIGVEEVSNFDVRVMGGEEELVNETKNMTLMPGNSWLVDKPWTVKVGTQVIKVEVDYNNEINETNETNNINATEIDVHGAEVTGNTTWESSGLHGQILFDPSQPYEEDYVTITANITNSGLTPATNFSTALLFDYQPDIYPTIESNNQLQNSFFKGSQKSNTISYTGARGVYVCIDTQNKTLLDRDAYGLIDWHQVFMIYDKNNTEVARTDESCGVLVPGDTVKLEKNEDNEVLPYIISFYPVYRANLTRDEKLTLNVNSSTNVSITVQKVTAGNHPVLLLIDPEGKVPEDVDNKTDNVVIRVMEVQTTRDFTVVEVIPERGNISDGEKINITANVSNAGYRNGTTTVQFVDYENESRIHSYYLTNSLPDCSRLSKSLLYLPVPPVETFSQEYKNLTILHRPGTDAIQLNFNWITQYEYDVSGKPCGEIHIYNLSGAEIRPNEWLKCGGGSLSTETINSIWIPGDTIFIYTLNADFNLTGYTTMKECHEENVTLNASVAWDESSSWKITELQSESKKITSLWNASTGTHNVTAIIDPDDEIIEKNETNNRYVLPLSVKATKELEIVDLNYSVQNPAPGQDPWHPGEGENVTIRAVVRNSGTATANLSVDLWLDTLKDSSSAPVPYNWNITLEGKTRYITFLNHTECSLAPGDHATVAARWENISVHGNPTYVVRAIADPLDEIDELNESDNEMSIELVMDYPDLTVAGFNAPTREERTASVELGNTGILKASEINVSLDMVKHEPLASKTGLLDITNDTIAINITMKGASKIRIHFASLDTTGENSYIEIRGVDEDGNLHPVKTYEGVKHENKWTPWWEGGGSISIDYTNANFYVDGYECGNIYRKEGASKIGICFNSLDTTGDNSYMDIYDGEATKVETYSGAVFGYKCTPWMKGNTTIIDYANAFFDVKELWWKEENITKIKAINASECEKVSLLESWTKYEGLVRLNVTVDPRNEIIEQREDNNNGSVLIYADLVPKGMDYVYENDKLIGFNASILNDDKAVEEGKGIAFPVYDFNVSLEVTPWDNETEVLYENSMRINESEKIYGGEVINVSFNVDVNELPENRTYNFTVVADSERRVYSWGEIEEINEGRYNEYAVQAGPDISVGEIYSELISSESCECYVGAVIKNEGDLSASNFSVRLNLNSTRKNGTYEEIIPLLGPKGGKENLTFRKDKVEIEPNAIYDVKITADSNNTVDELNEGNNEKEERIGPDLTIDRINYYSAKGAQREGDKLIVDENQTISVLVNNTGKVGAKDFEVKIWINTTNNTIIYNPSPVSVVCVPPGVVRPVPFQWTPIAGGWFILNATVDRYNNTPEWSKKGDAESNNDKLWEKIKAGLPGYKAKEGFLQAHGGDDEFNGGIIYTVGNTHRLGSDSMDTTLTTDFGNPIPEDATVRYARLYVYPDWAHWPNKNPRVEPWMAFLPDNTQLKVTFNGNELSNPIFTPEANNPDQPVDIPDATEWNATYATYYYYDVMAYYNNTPGVINQAVAERLEYPQTDYRYGIAGMALLIVYNDPNASLMRYWVGDDRDLIYAKEDSRESTGFEYDECTRKVKFEGVTDALLANATLKTVLVSYEPGKTLYQEAGGIADALYFNPNNVDNPDLNENLSIKVENKGHWHKVGGDIAITNGDNNDDGWVYVENLREGTNDAAIQSRGAMMGVAHAILKVTYPPDLVPSVNTGLKATAGNPYDIPITITNSGKSTARNFDVRISIDGKETSEHIDELEGGNSKTINIRKIAPAVEGFITFNVTVVADPENKVQELINNVRNGETNNNITETVKVVVSSGSLALPGLGGGGGSGGGWGTGTGTGEGSGSGEGRGTAGGTGEGERGETGSKTITGRLMKGTTVSREAGGGGKGGLSLIGWLIRLAMLAVAVVLVYAGYWHEKRRHEHEPEQ
ncbi:MAG: CARDB domain-containing protein [Halobacteriota archaeon]